MVVVDQPGRAGDLLALKRRHGGSFGGGACGVAKCGLHTLSDGLAARRVAPGRRLDLAVGDGADWRLPGPTRGLQPGPQLLDLLAIAHSVYTEQGAHRADGIQNSDPTCGRPDLTTVCLWAGELWWSPSLSR